MTRPWLDERIAANGLPVRENFAQWFGQSTVVDEHGAALKVFHGSRSDFDVFNTKCRGAVGDGAYFTPDPRLAAQYAMLDGAHAAGRIMPVYLKLLNPYRINEAEKHPTRRQLERSGYDGIIYTHSWNDGSVSVEYIAFEATQIKSAIGNCGLYLKGNASLTDHEAHHALVRARIAKAEVDSSAAPEFLRLAGAAS